MNERFEFYKKMEDHPINEEYGVSKDVCRLQEPD